MKNRVLLLLFSSTVMFLSLQAQPTDKIYVGVKGGTAFGVSTFSSFGADKTRFGMGGDIFGGYRLNKVFSVELSAGYSSLGMSAEKGCTDLWLSSDGLRYYAPIVGVNNSKYSDLYSSASLFNVGAHLNVSLLPAFGVKSRFMVDVSPAIYFASSQATVKEINGNQEVLKGSTNSHFGAGADLTLGYRVSNSIALGIYGGGVWYSGKALDAMPRVEHKGNYTSNIGVKLNFYFNSKQNSRKSAQTTTTQTVTPQVQTPKTTTVENKTEKPATTQEKVTAEVVQPQQPQQVAPKKEEQAQATAPKELLPTVYFGFNEVLIPENEMPKVRQIADILKANPTMNVELQGWSDNVGTKRANRSVSAQRAIELRYQLIKQGIQGGRITVKAMGEDASASSAERARRVETIEKQAK